MKLPYPVYFCRHVPVHLINWRPPVKSLSDDDSWFPALVEDIRANGLVNPLFIENRPPHDMWMSAGLNRLKALVEIGWKEVPAIITGALPVGVDGVLLSTLGAVQSYFRDGRARLRSDGLAFSFATLPESKTYPTTLTPYWPE